MKREGNNNQQKREMYQEMRKINMQLL